MRGGVPDAGSARFNICIRGVAVLELERRRGRLASSNQRAFTTGHPADSFDPGLAWNPRQLQTGPRAYV